MKRTVDPTSTVIIRLIAALAAVITSYQLTRPGFLFGITPDISAWLGGSIRLVHGAMPYRDFDLLQPPGFPLLASPLAFLSKWIGTRDALAILRLCTPLLSAASVLLMGRVVRVHGRVAVIVACGVMALYPAELYALRSGLLESVVAFFCLAGAALMFQGDSVATSRRRVLAGGVAFGIAGTVKAPAIVPVVVLAVLCLSDLRKRFIPFVGGVVAGFGIPTLPFFLMAPAAFIRDVIITPLSSIPAGNRVSIPVRLGDITGTSAFGDAWASIIATVVIVMLVVAAFLLPRRRPSTLEWFAIAATVLASLAQLGPSYYFANYTAFVTPFLGLLLGISVGRLVEHRSERIAPAIAALAVAILFTHQVFAISGSETLDIAGVVDAVIPAGGCTLSDAPSKLVTTNRFVSTTSACNALIDPEGATLSYGYGSAGAERLWTGMVEQADYMLTSTPFANWDIPPDAQLRAYVTANFHLIERGALLFYVRDGSPFGQP
jgi:alpha-1,2-mannosyltransferase